MKNNKNGGLFAGIIMGWLMVIGGTVFLWWNEKSMQLSPENALKIRKYMLKTYFGTEDQDTLEKYDQVIGAFSTFVMLVIPGKSKDSRKINPETAKAIVDTILPKFRQVAPMLPQMIGILD